MKTKTWWNGNELVESVMPPVAEAISRHIPERTPEWIDIYNRAYEAVFIALKQNNVLMTGVKSNIVTDDICSNHKREMV